MGNDVELNSHKTIKYIVDGEEISNKIDVKMVFLQNPIFNQKLNVIYPQIYLNGYKCDDYDELINNFINAKYVLDIVIETFKKELTVRYKKQKKNLKFIK